MYVYMKYICGVEKLKHISSKKCVWSVKGMYVIQYGVYMENCTFSKRFKW